METHIEINIMNNDNIHVRNFTMENIGIAILVEYRYSIVD